MTERNLDQVLTTAITAGAVIAGVAIAGGLLSGFMKPGGGNELNEYPDYYDGKNKKKKACKKRKQSR